MLYDYRFAIILVGLLTVVACLDLNKERQPCDENYAGSQPCWWDAGLVDADDITADGQTEADGDIAEDPLDDPSDAGGPSKIEDFKATASRGLFCTGGSIQLNWTNPTDPNFDHVEIYRGQAGDCPSSPATGEKIFDGDGTEAFDNGLTNNSSYCYSAFSADLNHNYSVGFSIPATPIGGAWLEYDSSAKNSGISGASVNARSPNLVLSPQNYPIVAYQSDLDDDCSEVVIKSWNGALWQDNRFSSAQFFDEPLSLNVKSVNPKIAMGQFPILLFQNKYNSSSAHPGIFMTQWNGAKWVKWGNGVNYSKVGNADDTYDSNPVMALDNQGYPAVAWSYNASSNNQVIYVKQWDGNDWIEHYNSATGNGISVTGLSLYPAIAVTSQGYPVVAWQYRANNGSPYKIYIKGWTGEYWQNYGKNSCAYEGISNSSGVAESPSLVLDGQDYPVVAWSDNTSGDYQIYAKRFNGQHWVEIGEHSATGVGISNMTGNENAMAPILARDSSGFFVIAWKMGVWVAYLSTHINNRIYIKGWNGSQWIEIGEHSASNSGISGTEISYSPSLALDPQGCPVVAWQEGFYSYDPYRSVYVKYFQWQGP